MNKQVLGIVIGLIVSLTCLFGQTFDLRNVNWIAEDAAGYNPFGDQQPPQEVIFNLFFDDLAGQGNFTYFITASKGGEDNPNKSIVKNGEIINPNLIDQPNIHDLRSAWNGDHELRYQLYVDEEGFIPLLDDGVTIDRRNWMNENLTSFEAFPIDERFFLTVFPGQNIPPGIYRDIVEFRIYTGPNRNFLDAELQYSERVNFYFKVGEFTEAEIVNQYMGLSKAPDHFNLPEFLFLEYHVETNALHSVHIVPLERNNSFGAEDYIVFDKNDEIESKGGRFNITPINQPGSSSGLVKVTHLPRTIDQLSDKSKHYFYLSIRTE